MGKYALLEWLKKKYPKADERQMRSLMVSNLYSEKLATAAYGEY